MENSLPEPDQANAEKLTEDDAQQFMKSIQEFHSQIREMPKFMEQACAIDQALFNRYHDLKASALAIINHLNGLKPGVLKRFDERLKPIAEEVLDALLRDAERLRSKLELQLETMSQATSIEWIDYASRWMQLCSKWHDRKALADKVLEFIAKQTTQLIDKDIRVIQDYQTQSLAHLSKESDEFKNVEERMSKAIDEPLRQLLELRNQSLQQTSLKQASELVANLQEQRESYFDQLLMKIDNVVKDVVYLDEEDEDEWVSFSEFEGEIVFIEREFHHINEMLPNLHTSSKSDIHFIETRLEDLLDHAEQIEASYLPKALRRRVLKLIEQIILASDRIALL